MSPPPPTMSPPPTPPMPTVPAQDTDKEFKEFKEELELESPSPAPEPKLLEPPSTLAKKSSREKAGSNTFHSRRRSLSTRIKPKLREFPRRSRESNTKKKEKLRPSLVRSPLPTIMPLSILDSTFLNMFLKRKLNTFRFPRNRSDTNTSLLRDKLSTTPIKPLKLRELKAELRAELRPEEDMLKNIELSMFSSQLLNRE